MMMSYWLSPNPPHITDPLWVSKINKMKNLVYILILLSNSLFSQEQWEIDMIEEDSKYHFDTGSQIYNVAQNIIEFDNQIENLDTTSYKDKLKYEILSDQRNQVLSYALWEFDRILEYYPTSTLLNQTVFNKAQIHYELNQIDSARTYYLKLIEKKIPSELDTSQIVSIKDERYFNFKNSAYKRLSELEYENGNYEQSIIYLNNSEEIGYDHFCGNEHASNSQYLAISYAKNYYEIDSLDKAIELLLPHLLRNGLTRNNDAVELAIKYLLQQYDRDYLISELEKGFNNYVKKKPRPTSKSNKYFVNFLGREIQLFMYEHEDLTKEKQMVKEILENEYLYMRLKGEKPTHNMR